MRRLALLAPVLVGCGRIGFDADGVPGGDDTNMLIDSAVDADPGLVTTPFLDCDGIDDGVHIRLFVTFVAKTFELRARVVDPVAAGIGEHELITVSQTSSPSRLIGLRVEADLEPSSAGPSYTTRLEMFESLDGALVTGVSGPAGVEARWTHYAMVFIPASGRYEVFRDGIRSGNPLTLSASNLEDFDLCGNASGRHLQAEIDWVRISVTARYTAPFTPMEARPAVDPDTLALLDFDGGTVTDISGNSTVTTSGGVLIGQP